MKQYLDIVNRVLKQGKWKGNRTGVRTLACANVCFSHEMSEGFPLLTTKRVPLRVLAVELEGFIQGQTSKKWYQDRNCNIWNEWCNAQALREYLDQSEHPLGGSASQDEVKAIQARIDDLGPIYGRQWRRYGEHYGNIPRYDLSNVVDIIDTYKLNGVLQGTDQLKNIVDMLKKNPNDRRMVCSAWNPNQMDQMALPPCHYAWNVVVIDDTINLFWAQRSCDLMLGVPFNIASYALLLCLLAKESGLKPGNLSGMLCDCHIYENHLDGAYEQVCRTPTELPTIEVLSKGIFDWTHQDLKLQNYTHQPTIKFEVAI
jgi:thymidylate synthase